MGKVGEGHIIQHIHNRAFQDGDRLVEFGDDAFVTTATTKEVTTLLSAVEVALLTIKDVTPVANDLLGTDGVVTTGAVTVARPAGTTSALGFYYMFIGRRYD
jgi:hypothetical protein